MGKPVTSHCRDFCSSLNLAQKVPTNFENCQNLARLRELQKSLQWEVTGLPHPFLQVKLRMMPYYIIGTHVQQPTTGIKAPHRVYFRSTILDFIFSIFT